MANNDGVAELFRELFFGENMNVNDGVKGDRVVKCMSEWDEFIEKLKMPCDDMDKLLLSLKISKNDHIKIPSMMELYEGLDITEKDNLFVQIDGDMRINDKVLFLNGEDRVVGFFNMSTYLVDGEMKHYLTANRDDLDFENHSSANYYFLFYDNTMKCYKIRIEVRYEELQKTSTHLCIDFGTSNTTAGCYLDTEYVGNVSNIARINGNIQLGMENYTTFDIKDMFVGKKDIKTISWSRLVPTMVYVVNCEEKSKIEYAFGYDAAKRIKEDNYCPRASCFMEIKRWTSDIDKEERIKDIDGINVAKVKRREIIKEYLMYIIRCSENQFKCKFTKIHISAPVKLKEKVLDVYEELLLEAGYLLEKENAIDEGIAVLYNIINQSIKDKKYGTRKALIIDCGGGTSDLASCSYEIKKDNDDYIDLKIVTEYMNGDVNFGGNNLTYRILQYMKVVYAEQIENNGKRIGIDELITYNINNIFSHIEGDDDEEFENKDVVDRYKDIYKELEERYEKAEKIIPTKFAEYETETKEVYDKVKNNFYFLWKLAEEMKKEFYKSTSISRYTFDAKRDGNEDVDLHVNRIENWRLSFVGASGKLEEQKYPDITFTAKEIDKLLRGDIYYLVRKFLNALYEDGSLNDYSQIKLSGQSAKISIFMDSLKEFLPGKKIKVGGMKAKGNDAEELKLACLKGAILYLHTRASSIIEPEIYNEVQSIPFSVYVENENQQPSVMFNQGKDWKQPAAKRRITNGGKEVCLFMKDRNRTERETYKYVYENEIYQKITFDELQNLMENRIKEDDISNMITDKKYIFVSLNKAKWGFNIVPIYRDEDAQLFAGKVHFCSFDMDVLQETFFDGRK